jgi:hypothetical protein
MTKPPNAVILSVSEESPVLLFKRTLKNEILYYVHDNEKRLNDDH